MPTLESPRTADTLLHGLARHLQPLNGGPQDYDGLLERVGDARFALLGEASHGTREFYRERIRITRRLIIEKGFSRLLKYAAPTRFV
jgi:erythromycin esterase-like protein